MRTNGFALLNREIRPICDIFLRVFRDLREDFC